MNRLVIILLVVSILGNLIGAFVLYKYLNLKGYFADSEARVTEITHLTKGQEASVSELIAELDKTAEHRLVFLHHSVGKGIYEVGGLRERLLKMGILPKSCTYKDDLGENTDIQDWAVKFDERFDEILRFRSHQAPYAPDSVQNDIVMFKSCFPNSNIVSAGTEPGDPRSPEKTIANYRATFAELRKKFEANPDRLFVYLTSPPLHPSSTNLDNAARAREFTQWLMNDFAPEYRAETGLDNFVAFDLFDVLAGPDNTLKAEYRRSRDGDSHPNKKGYETAAEAFMAFLTPVWENWNKDRAKS